jgi:hypothetical protein
MFFLPLSASLLQSHQDLQRAPFSTAACPLGFACAIPTAWDTLCPCGHLEALNKHHFLKSLFLVSLTGQESFFVLGFFICVSLMNLSYVAWYYNYLGTYEIFLFNCDSLYHTGPNVSNTLLGCKHLFS